MESTKPVSGAETAFELADFAASLVAARHIRDYPEATDADVQRAVNRWWSDCSRAPNGDCPGRVRTLAT